MQAHQGKMPPGRSAGAHFRSQMLKCDMELRWQRWQGHSKQPAFEGTDSDFAQDALPGTIRPPAAVAELGLILALGRTVIVSPPHSPDSAARRQRISSSHKEAHKPMLQHWRQLPPWDTRAAQRRGKPDALAADIAV